MTPEQREYLRKIKSYINRLQSLDDETVRRMIELLVQVKREIRLVVADGDLSQQHLNAISSGIDELARDLQQELTNDLTRAINGAWELGDRSIYDPLSVLGNMGLVNIPLSPVRLNALLDFSVDLVTKITSEMNQQITSQIRMLALGGATPHQAMLAVTNILGIQKNRKIIGGVSYRAERIVRTEINRVFSVAQHSRRLAVNEKTPLLKRWIASGDSRTRRSHLVAHAKYKNEPIPVKKPYIVGGAELMFPRDPSAPASETVNCRCTEITIHPDIGNFGFELDDRIGDILSNK